MTARLYAPTPVRLGRGYNTPMLQRCLRNPRHRLPAAHYRFSGTNQAVRSRPAPAQNSVLAGTTPLRKSRRQPVETTMPAPYEKHRAQLKAILLAWCMPEDNAEATADILSWADLHGVDSHGLSMIPGYDRLRRAGRANMAARPRIIKETPVSALVDGDGGLGHVPARFAMQVAIDKAKQSGMAIAAVRNSAHFGATGYYTLMAAKGG